MFELSTALAEPVEKFCRILSQAAADHNVRIYLVGGMLRDVLMGRPLDDIDIAIEGSAANFAKYLKENWSKYFPNATATPAPIGLKSFEKYQTAKLEFSKPFLQQMFSLDFASTRSEFYPQPASTPVIKFADLRQDLARRDFSINAMATLLVKEGPFIVIDLFNGLEHLRSRQLSILYEKSFDDDPVRIIRGARFAKRFSYSFDDMTAKCAKQAIIARRFDALSGRRLFEEVRKLLSERDTAAILEYLNQIGAYVQIFSGATLSNNLLEDVQTIQKYYAERDTWKVIFARISLELTNEAFVKLIKRFSLSGKEKSEFLELRRNLKS